jgi:poly-gamma-glutamate system protein
MKRLYWRPQRVSARVLLLLAVVSVVGLLMVETFKVRERQPYYREKLGASRLTRKAFQVVKEERLRRGIRIDPVSDPARSGLIGPLISQTTTNTGHLSAKQTTVNPNFAAVFVHMLKRAGVKAGDAVAIGPSGSFPAMNIAALAALKTIKARPLIISSVGSSQWGANHPDFMFTDMERVLRRRGLLPFRSIAVSLGGVDDQAVGLDEQGRKALEKAIERNRMSPLRAANYDESLSLRMKLYREHAGEAEITAYINIGGGTTSVGTRVGKRMFKPGLNRWIPRGAAAIDSVMTRFAKRGVPVIHVTKIDELAQRYGLPLQPKTMPPVGEGKIFVREGYSPWLIVVALVVLLGLMFAFLRLDLAYRLFSAKPAGSDSSRPEQMV